MWQPGRLATTGADSVEAWSLESETLGNCAIVPASTIDGFCGICDQAEAKGGPIFRCWILGFFGQGEGYQVRYAQTRRLYAPGYSDPGCISGASHGYSRNTCLQLTIVAGSCEFPHGKASTPKLLPSPSPPSPSSSFMSAMATDFGELWKKARTEKGETESVRTLAKILSSKEGRVFIQDLDPPDAEFCIEILDHVSQNPPIDRA